MTQSDAKMSWLQCRHANIERLTVRRMILLDNAQTNLRPKAAPEGTGLRYEDQNNGTRLVFEVPGATSNLQGVMQPSEKIKLKGVEAGAQVNVPTNLSVANNTTTGLDITSSTGTDVSLTGATTELAGLMLSSDRDFVNSKSQANGIASLGPDGIVPWSELPPLPGAGNTNLGKTNETDTSIELTSTTGTGVTLTEAVPTVTAGLLSGSDKNKLDGVEAGAEVNVDTDLGVANNTVSTLDITSSTGTDATIPAALTTAAGLMSAADKTKLDGVEAGAEVNIDTDLGVANNTPTGLDITSSTGTDVSLSGATTALAGLMLSSDRDFVNSKAQANGLASLGADGLVPSSQLPAPSSLETLFGMYGTVIKDWTAPEDPTSAGFSLSTAAWTTNQNDYFIQLTNGQSQTSIISLDAGNFLNFRFEVYVKIESTGDPADILGFFANGITATPLDENNTGGLIYYTDLFNNNTHTSTSYIFDGPTVVRGPQATGMFNCFGNYYKFTMTRYNNFIEVLNEGYYFGRVRETGTSLTSTSGTYFGILGRTGGEIINCQIKSIKLTVIT